MKFILYFFTINFIQSIIVLPLQKFNQEPNISNTYQFINYFESKNLFSVVKIGEPLQEIEILIKDGEYKFLIDSYYCNLKSFYNKSLSKTFTYNINIEDETDYYLKEDNIAQETFYVYSDLNLQNIKKIENIKFKYEEKINEIYNCAKISLQIFKNNYNNFIFQLKKLGYIDNYSWTIKFIENDTNFEGYLIIGDYPHIYESKIYDEIDLRTTLNNVAESGWNLEFKNIYFNDTYLTHYMTGIISFSTLGIIGTEEYKSKIGPDFFRYYIDKNICYEDSSSTHYFIYYCKSNLFNKTDINKFPILKFYHYQYNYTFSFSGEDLFMKSNGYYYFMIVFDRYNYRQWTFGKLFLRKYQLVYNPDSKMIIYYINKKDANGNTNSEENTSFGIDNKNLIIIILVVIGIISFIIGLIIGSFVYSKKKKTNANEMKEEYLYEKKESLEDSYNYKYDETKITDTINN